jgi:hypothetical protein
MFLGGVHRSLGINNSGQIVGSFVAGGTFYGFVDTGGSFTTIDVPGASSTQGAFGINDSGQVVGWWFDVTGDHGFVATPVPEPPSSLTLATCLVALLAMAGHRNAPSAHQTRFAETGPSPAHILGPRFLCRGCALGGDHINEWL